MKSYTIGVALFTAVAAAFASAAVAEQAVAPPVEGDHPAGPDQGPPLARAHGIGSGEREGGSGERDGGAGGVTRARSRSASALSSVARRVSRPRHRDRQRRRAMASGTPATIRPTARAASVTPAAGSAWVLQNKKWTLIGSGFCRAKVATAAARSATTR